MVNTGYWNNLKNLRYRASNRRSLKFSRDDILRKAFILYLTILLMLSGFPLVSMNIYAPTVGGDTGDLNQTGNETGGGEDLNQTPDLNITTEPTFNLTNTDPLDPYSTLTTCDGRFRFYRRNVQNKLVEFTDNEGYKISFTQEQQIQYFHNDSKRFMVTYQEFTTIYETISNTKVKNTIILYSNPSSNTINETINYDTSKLDYYFLDGSIYFIEKKLSNQLVYRAPKFQIEKPYAIDSNGTYGHCYYELVGDNLKLIIDRNFLDQSVYPVFVDPTWIDNITSDWDNGNKSMSNDSFEIVSYTDNGGTTENAIELENMKSSKFTSSSTDLTNWKWTEIQFSGAAGDGDINTTTAGEMRISETASGSSTFGCESGTMLDVSFDFEVQIDVDSGADPNNDYWEMTLYVADNDYGSGTSAGIAICRNVVRKDWTGIGTGSARTWAGSSGVSIGKLKIAWTQATGTLTSSYYNGAWNQLWTSAGLTPNDMRVRLTIHTNDPAVTVDFDNFIVNSGTLLPGAYRSSGTWTSQNLTLPSGATINNWTLNITNCDSNHYVNISFLQSGEEERARYNNITENITITQDMLSNLSKVKPGTFYYKIEFFGNGTSSPIVDSSYGFQNYRPISIVSDYDIHAETNEKVELDGSSSYDPDGSIQNYTWSININGTPTFLYGEIVNYTFTEEGLYLFELLVTDNNNYTSSPTEVYITVEDPDPPTTPTIEESVTSGIGIVFTVLIVIIAAMWFINKARATL